MRPHTGGTNEQDPGGLFFSCLAAGSSSARGASSKESAYCESLIGGSFE